MKLENFLAPYLYNSKSLTLQGIGKFELSADFVAPQEGDKDFVMPQNAIVFTYDGRATEDDALVSYIVQQTKKIKPLASADLDSYLTLGKQFLNIGKPFNIEGIGALEKNQKGEYFFTQGHYVNQKIENTLSTSTAKENIATEISFASKPKEKKSNKKALVIAGLAIMAALLGVTIWYFVNKKSVPPIAEIKAKDTLAINAIVDTNKVKKDALPTTSNPNTVTDNFTFKVVLKNYPNLATATKSFEKLTSYGHKLQLYTKDSVVYKVAMPFTRPLSDTAYARDSVKKKLFGGNPYIEAN